MATKSSPPFPLFVCDAKSHVPYDNLSATLVDQRNLIYVPGYHYLAHFMLRSAWICQCQTLSLAITLQSSSRSRRHKEKELSSCIEIFRMCTSFYKLSCQPQGIPRRNRSTPPAPGQCLTHSMITTNVAFDTNDPKGNLQTVYRTTQMP